ncbi:MAG: 1-deoxy-D-xylulose-5-phosphate synthase [Candidatus Omnitrophota bacterium]|nr:1-deoxy-D-xylulose-5-phosphate synthase [Candidatus Omnitrophota bacterium]
MSRLIDSINSPVDLRKLKLVDLPMLAKEIRQEMLSTVSKTGGHLSSSLGAVELAIAIHYSFDTPRDCVLWDVGHQAYAHKILTGRARYFSTLRQLGGLSGFPNKDESPEYDMFTCGHSSTSISTGLGLVMASGLNKDRRKVIAVIGDAALAGGMAFEALNHVGHSKKNMIVILNDNELSITKSVGALSRYLNRIITNPAYNKIRNDVEKVLKRIPRFGFRAYRAARKLEEGLKNLLIPGMLFEELGFRYFGPIDGHNAAQMITVFKNLINLDEPILIHVITRKGKGYKYSEKNPSEFHSTGPFDIETGIPIKKVAKETFTEAFCEKIVDLAKADERIVGVTAAMIDGTGFDKFAKEFPQRFYDVGISEEHAVGLSAGLARGGYRPVVAIYSTFLQRAYDQIIHDVCLQDLPVVFCLDRAGLVGEDGPTHHGVFDIAYTRHMPNLIVMAPKDTDELKAMLSFAIRQNKPIAMRYPRGSLPSLTNEASLIYAKHGLETEPVNTGKSEMIKEGGDIAIIAIGSMVTTAVEVSAILFKKKIDASVVNARFVHPIDGEMIEKICASCKRIVTIEEGVLEGGFGSAVLEFIERENIKGVRVKRFGLPDRFIEHGKREELFKKYNLTPDAICDVIMREVMV